MKTRPRILAPVVLFIALALAYGAWAAIRASRDVVTLNVRDMDVRKVVRKIQWQTWERIYVHSAVEGKVTLNVRKMPLTEVLRIVGDQTSSRWSSLYPLYSTRKSLLALKKSLRGELDPAVSGWTNLARGGFGEGRFGGGPFGPGGGRFGPATEGNSNRLVSLELHSKDVPFAVAALSRFTQARIVPEDGTTGLITLTLDQAPVAEAVRELARKTRRDWTMLYTLRGGFGPGGPGRFARREPDGPGRFRPGFDAADREAMRDRRRAFEEELKQTLPEEEREKMEQAQQEREQLMQDMANLTPEQRRERFAQMGGQNMSQRMLDRIRNSTPEQRAEQRREMRERRQQFERGPGRRP